MENHQQNIVKIILELRRMFMCLDVNPDFYFSEIDIELNKYKDVNKLSNTKYKHICTDLNLSLYNLSFHYNNKKIKRLVFKDKIKLFPNLKPFLKKIKKKSY